MDGEQGGRGEDAELESAPSGAAGAGGEAGAEPAGSAEGARPAEAEPEPDGAAGEATAEPSGDRREATAEPNGDRREATAEPSGDRREATAEPSGDRREATAERRPRRTAALLIGLLLGLLGFALAVQVRSNTSTSGLTAARQEDLVRILDELSSREDRLRRQIADLEATRTRLSTTGDSSAAALEEARTRSTTLGILAGTLPAQGPGIELTLTDPEQHLAAEDLLDAVEELRAAGAEAVQVGGVRVGLDSSFTSTERGIAVDGVPLAAPYTILAIGDPQTLATAMEIPGGVTDTVGRAGGEARVGQRERMVIRALRPLKEPQYSRPSDGGR